MGARSSTAAWTGLLALLLALTGCGYALVGRGIAVDPDIKVIGVPLFKDRTGKVGLDQIVTDKVIEELLKRGRFEVVQSDEGVDALVDGELTNYRAVPVGFGNDGGGEATTQATQYSIVLTSKVIYSKVGQDQPIWQSSSFRFRDEYDVGDDPEAFFDREDQALERLAGQYAESLVSTMLEAF